jgi:hypothetical protein
MRTAAVMLSILALAIPFGCARHVVVERDFGRVDGERSITTNSDTAWTIRHEPEAASDEEN